jgi:glycosyltransferase involved in cell wall biosynthesis
VNSGERVPVLYLAPWVDYGGSDKGTIDWFRWLDRTRFRPSLITTQPSKNRRLAEVAPFADEIWALPDLMSGARFPEFIVDFIVSREVAVVHIMNSRIAFDLLPDIHALDRRPRIVVQLHVEEPDRDGYVRYVATRYGTLVDAFSVSSEHLATAVADYGIPRDRIEVIHTGVDAEIEFAPERVAPIAQLTPGVAHILYPGRVTAQKDPLLMVEVARELDARELDFCLHVVGSGELDEAVRERVSGHGLAERVRFHPPTRELPAWYRAADVLLMTSLFEGVPYVVYEALAMGVPVVAPALPGNLELMDGVGGTLVEPRDDALAYADALEPLLRDRALRQRVGAAGRERMLERFGLRTMGDLHGRLYDRLREDASPLDRGPDAGLDERVSFVSRPSRGTPLVSIVTPCFNHGRWLRECVAAVREQSYRELEMIVCDDGSTELETLDYLEELEREPGVRVVRMAENAGPSAARNRAIAESRGRYVLPVDADNLLLPDAVDRLVAHLQGAGSHVGYVYQNLQFFGNREDYFEAPAFNAWQLTRGNYIDTCALIDREVFDHGFRYPDEMRFGHEDWDFVLSLAERGVYGEPIRAKTLRYRKHGFSRSDRIDWAHPSYAEFVAEHPTLTAQEHQARGDNQWVRLKARWSPSLSVIALGALSSDSPSWAQVAAGLRAQHFRDFEFYAALDREQPADRYHPPVRMLPARLAARPAQALAHALEVSGARNIVVTSGDGADVLADPGSLERVTRLLERGAAGARLLCFADAGPGEYPFAPIAGDDPSVLTHTVAWSRAHAQLLESPASFDEQDPIGGIGRSLQRERVPIQWRHLRGGLKQRDGAAGSRFVSVRPPALSRAERSDRRTRIEAPPALPGVSTTIPRWKGLRTWIPAATSPLVRHRRLDRDEWVVDHSFEPPDGFFTEHYLGVAHMHSLEGTARLVEDGASGYAGLPLGGEPDADEMDRTLGYIDTVPLPMFELLSMARHTTSGAPVLVCGAEDPILSTVEPASMVALGWIDRVPVNPRSVPGDVESTAWLRGLVRRVDAAARRHRVSIGELAGQSRGSWELGALLDRDPGEGIAAWVDADGRLHTRDYAPTRYPFDVRRSARWLAAPATWQGFGRAVPRARAIARRSLDIARYVGSRPGLAAAMAPPERADGWFLDQEGPDRVAIFSAMHPVTADQLVTRDPSEARDLGYGSVRLIGYALALAPATGTLARPLMSIPWGSRFGEALTRSEEPLL